MQAWIFRARSASRSVSRQFFGIGRATALTVLERTGISPSTRVRDLTDAEVARLRQAIERDLRVEGALRTEVAMNIKRLMDIGCYPGHAAPPRPPGARPAHPHNARTKKGPRRTIAGKKKATLKK